MNFSIVVPVKDEVDLIPRTLPSYYAVGPSEVIVCTDKPTPRRVREVVQKVAVACDAQDITRIVEVERDSKWSFHQANVRRTGFKKAKCDRILTVDIDLVINRNALKAVRLVGEDDVGLVSLSKFEYPKDLLSFSRLMGIKFLQKFVHRFAKAYRGKGIATTTFTGLYALWRPYWLDSEDKGIKKLVNPKQKLRQGISKEWTLEDFYGTGEDTYLQNCMERKHKLIYLPDIGCIVLTNPLEAHPDVQYSKGIYFALRGRNLIAALVRTIFRLQPHYLCGHFYGKRVLHVLARKKTSYSLDDAREYWQFSPSSIGHGKITSKKLVQASDADVKKFIEKSIKYRDKKEGARVYRNRVSDWINRENIRKILDFGCGLGQDGVYFAKTLGIQVTFADIVSSNIELTKRYTQIWSIPTKSIYIDCEAKEFHFPEVYDMIFANGVLHHTPEAKELVQNLKRFLKAHGLFICMLYARKHFKATGARTLEEYSLLSEGSAPIPNPYSDFYDAEKAKKTFEGYELVETFTTHKGKFGWYIFRRETNANAKK